jgi:hypothetical protein
MLVNQLKRDPHANSKWGVLRALSSEFIFPDLPTRMFVPITPTCCLIASAPDMTINEDTVALINRTNVAGSETYYFARDLAVCPL